jgi:hypothetical protein
VGSLRSRLPERPTAREREDDMSVGRGTWRRGAAWLALLSFVLQIAISLGHVHPVGFFSRGRLVKIDDAVLAITPDATGASLPEKHPPAASDRHNCPICLREQTVGGFVIPAAPHAPPPFARLAAPERRAGPNWSTSAHLLFWTRAPPIA